jgi:hypothetical protein
VVFYDHYYEVFSCLGFGYPFKPNLGLNTVP